MLADQVTFCVIVLGLRTRTRVKVTSSAQLCYKLLGHIIDEKLVTPELAICISRVAIRTLRHSPRMRTLGRVSSSVGRRLHLSLRAFHALLGGGLLVFERGGGGLNTLLDPQKCTFNLGAEGGGGGSGRARKLRHAFQIITKRFNDPHSAININNAQYIVYKTPDPLG